MSKTKKQTAVEWLYNHLFPKQLDGFSSDEWDKIDKAFNQAKAMEKEQIMMAVKDSWYMAKGSNFQEPQEEQYYNETYNND